MGVLKDLVAEDFGISGHGRWYKAVDHDSLVVDDVKDVFYWNSANIYGGALDYLTKVRKMPFVEALAYLKSLPYYSETLVLDVDSDRKNDTVIVNPKLVDVFHERCMAENKSYWEARGLSDCTIRMFQLGWTGEYFTIPLFKDGVFKNFQLRRDYPEKRIRYLYRLGERYFFNEDIFRLFNVDEVIITEEPVDCMRLFQEGYYAVSHTMGASGWDLRWNPLFDGVKQIYVLYDNDPAGVHGAINLAKHLGERRTKIYTFWDFSKRGYDVVDFFNDGHTENDLAKILYQESKYIFELKLESVV